LYLICFLDDSILQNFKADDISMEFGPGKSLLEQIKRKSSSEENSENSGGDSDIV
jgi:hypothetical protein